MKAFIPPSPSLTSISFRTSLSFHPLTRNCPPSCATARRRRRAIVTSSLPDLSPATKRVCSLAVMVSGSGRSLQNLIDKISDGALTNCNIDLVVCSKSSAGAIDRAAKCNIPTVVLQLKDFNNDNQAFSDAISSQFDTINPHLIVMAGWMHFYQIPDRYIGKVINIHPSLIPAFCGKGYYGSRVHRAVVDFGVKITGCTVHLADNIYDHGPIILQKVVPVNQDDSPDDVGARVFESEKLALPEAVQMFVDERISVVDGKVRINEKTVSVET